MEDGNNAGRMGVESQAHVSMVVKGIGGKK